MNNEAAAELKSMQKVYISIRPIHEHLAEIQRIVDQYGLNVKGVPSLAEVQEALRMYHNWARIREDEIKKSNQTSFSNSEAYK